jgi:hypothetical protein
VYVEASAGDDASPTPSAGLMVSADPNVSVVPMPFTHLEPAWDAIDEVTAVRTVPPTH